MTQTAYQAFLEAAHDMPGNAFLAAPSMEGRAYHPEGVEFTYGEVRNKKKNTQTCGLDIYIIYYKVK